MFFITKLSAVQPAADEIFWCTHHGIFNHMFNQLKFTASKQSLQRKSLRPRKSFI